MEFMTDHEHHKVLNEHAKKDFYVEGKIKNKTQSCKECGPVKKWDLQKYLRHWNDPQHSNDREFDEGHTNFMN